MIKQKAYFIGGGIASLSGALFLIRDGNFSGENITIFEHDDQLGGCLDGTLYQDAFISRGGRMFEEHYKGYCHPQVLWDAIKALNR